MATSVAGRSAAAPAAEDGRHARRERNRDAVVDSLLALYRLGNLEPSADEVAAHAGISPRSVFRYFDDVDDLCRAAIARQLERVGPLSGLTIDVEAPLAERIDAVVAQRLRLFEAMGAVGRVSRLREPFQPLVAAQLAAGRATLRSQVSTSFAPELARVEAAEAARIVAAIDVLCSFESHQLLRDDHGFGRARIAATLATSIRRLLADAS